MKFSAVHQSIIFTCLTLSALLILDSFNPIHALTMFIIIGQIPGTDVILDANTMLTLLAFIAGIITSRLTSRWVITALHREVRYSQPTTATLVK